MTETESMRDYTRQFWAKAQPYRQRGPERIHLLEHHLADVGACFEALLAQPNIRRRLAHSGGLEDLDNATAARLALFAALHDIGKVNVGFQTQIWKETDFPAAQRRPGHAGHYHELAPVMGNEDCTTAGWFFDSLGWWWDAIESWDDRGGETVCALFVAALSHHGQPMKLEGGLSSNSALWNPFGDLDPAEGVRRIGELARRWFPAACQPSAPPLPSAPAFQHTFLGLCTLADWIGSNEAWFPFCAEPRDDYMEEARQKAQRAVSTIGLDLSKQRVEFPAKLPDATQLLGFSPNAIQRAAAQETSLDEPVIVIESETGSGKTEAVLWRFARMYRQGLVDGLYFALPTRAAATQIHERVSRFVERMFPVGSRPETVLAVPGYLKVGDISGHRLQDYEVWWEDSQDATVRNRRWAAESAKRYLAAQIAVGTVDQAMMAALKVKHAHMRAACLSRNLLVVDEVHASDTYMSRILKSLLDTHLGAGGYAVLMSATLGSAARRQWLSTGRFHSDDAPPWDAALKSPYPSVSVRTGSGESMAAVGENHQGKNVNIVALPNMNNFGAVAERALQAARDGAKVLVIRNTVAYAAGTQQAAEQSVAGADRSLLFACNETPALHHGRFATDDRGLLDHAVEERLGKERPAGGIVVVGTQTLEQSLDIDADLLITDLCPVDVLLQRIGRLHRHQRDDRPAGYETPTCEVLLPEGEDLSPLLKRRADRNGLGPHGYVYEDLRVLEATRRLIGDNAKWSIPAMNRELVEKATHPAALGIIVEELGEDWKEHAIRLAGGEIADWQVANNAIIRRDKSFFTDNRDVLFGSDEDKIRTRLGDEGIDVQFTPSPPSPFDSARTIDKIALPHRWLGDSRAPESVEPSPMSDGGFTFSIGKRTFRYDRLGLRREG